MAMKTEKCDPYEWNIWNSMDFSGEFCRTVRKTKSNHQVALKIVWDLQSIVSSPNNLTQTASSNSGALMAWE